MIYSESLLLYRDFQTEKSRLKGNEPASSDVMLCYGKEERIYNIYIISCLRYVILCHRKDGL